MQLVVMLISALLFEPPIAVGADASNCSQATEVAAARVRWAAVRQSRSRPASQAKGDCLRSHKSALFWRSGAGVSMKRRIKMLAPNASDRAINRPFSPLMRHRSENLSNTT